jgi:8-oxo-dGTP diphosphatase
MKPAQYVNGFLFDPTLLKVALIRKNKPVQQEGLLNGVGGKIDRGETPLQAMCREFKEETGMVVQDWQEFAVIKWKGSHHPQGAVMHLLCATGNVFAVRSLTAEQVGVYDVAEIMNRPDTLYNLRWIIQMGRARYFGDQFEIYKIEGVTR